MAAVLNDLMAQHKSRSLNIATAYFNVGGWQLLRKIDAVVYRLYRLTKAEIAVVEGRG